MSSIEPKVSEPWGDQSAARSLRVKAGAVDIALRRFNRHSPIDDDDRDLVQSMVGPQTEHRTGADLGDDGDSTCKLLLSGWAGRVSETPWGGRQILDFVLPGDSIGLSLTPRVDGLYRVVALNRAITVDARSLRDHLRLESRDFPGLKLACQREEQMTWRRMIQHTSRLGGAAALQTMVHLLLELRSRMAAIDLLQDGRFPMPLSQDNLHEALGITSTQVYRVLSQLRREGLIVLGQGWARIPDPGALALAGNLKQWRA